MATTYRAVGWNAQKRHYDLVLAASVLAGLGLFAAITAWLAPEATIEAVLIRACGLTAFVLLHVVLSIGPLCRLDARFLPLLYNRRHLGVATFSLGLAHGAVAFVLHHTLGDANPLASLFVGGSARGGLAALPFQPFGLFALLVLFAMAATSHDFWLRTLSPRVWKGLHMGVYVAYAALVLHVALGYLQAERSPAVAVAVAIGLAWVLALHVVAGRREARVDAQSTAADAGAFVDVGAVDSIRENAAIPAVVAGERIAVFRHGGCVSAVSAVCRHQHGPLAEGRVVDGCITCPWHGYQYRPRDGTAPPPFHEKLPTFRVRVANGRVLVDARPLPAGTDVEPACVDGTAPPASELYVGWKDTQSPPQQAFTRRAVRVFALGALAAIALVAGTQRTLGGGAFEFGVVRTFEGLLETTPHPLLHVEAPVGGRASWLVVGAGKHGADEALAAFAGKVVALRGSLVHRDGAVAIELEPGSVTQLDALPTTTAPDAEELGEAVLRGEIVDSKCHLGVMTPGDKETHRACARICIAGGVPPLFVAADERGTVRRFLLVDRDGRPIGSKVLDFVGEPVEVRGAMARRGDLLVLRIDPTDLRRL